MNTIKKSSTIYKYNIFRYIIFLLIKFKQLLGFTGKTYNMFRHVKNNVYVRKGHLLSNPTKEQVKSLMNELLRRIRIHQWKIEDNTSLYESEGTFNNYNKRDRSIIDRVIIKNIANRDKDSVLDIHDEYLEKYGHGINTHIFIHPSGTVEKVFNYNNIVKHTPIHNTSSISVSIQYDSLNKEPTNRIMYALEKTLVILCLEFKLNPFKAIKGQKEIKFISMLKSLFGYKDIGWKSPGVLLDMDNLRRDVAIKLQKKLHYAGLYNGNITGKIDKQTKKALNAFNSNSIKYIYNKFEILNKN